MEKHIENKYDETYYTHQCSNGLRLIIWHKPEMKTTSCVFATPYGALDFEQIDKEGRHFFHPSGIAHFLEHKMFESDGVDVMNEFASLGANVNAFTSYSETMYYFSTSSQNIQRPLNLLLDFVQELNISEESVEKEKGIITQELMMYLQMPDSRLYFELFKAMFHEHAFKYDIGGTPQSVENTTYEQLMECFKLNYHPKKMILVCAGPIDPSAILEIVEENQKKKSFDTYIECKRKPIVEPESVVNENLQILMDVSATKVAVGIKLKPWVSTSRDKICQEWAIRFAFESHFSSLNVDYQRWIDQDIINNYFDFDVDMQTDVAFISFVNETEEKEKFKQFIMEELQKCINEGISLKLLNQLKKRYFGQAMRVLNSVEDIAVTDARNKLNHISLFETLDILQSLDQKMIKEALSHISLENVAMVSIMKKSES